MSRVVCVIARVAALLAVLLGAAAAPAWAQDAGIAGVARDASGAVLPGVTVTATSPVLIEKTRAVVTDGQGRFTIVDLRPGTYRITFALTGFNTLVRDGLELPADFTATVSVQLSVGSLQESVTVSGQSPMVDVQSTARTLVISRDLLDGMAGNESQVVWDVPASVFPNGQRSRRSSG